MRLVASLPYIPHGDLVDLIQTRISKNLMSEQGIEHHIKILVKNS